MPRSISLLSVLLPVALVAVEPNPPALSLTMPDIVRTGRSLAEGPGRGMATDPALGGMRTQLAQMGAADATWRSLPQHATTLRAELLIGPAAGGMPVLDVMAGVMLPVDQEPTALSALRVARAGAWVLLGLTGRDLALPERTPVEVRGRPLDLAFVANLAACEPLLGAWSRVPVAWGATTAQMMVGVEGDAVVESLNLSGAWPVRPVDPALLAGMPSQAHMVLALGVDGQALAARIRPAITAAGYDLATLEAEMQGRYGFAPEVLATGLDGTVVLAILPGSGFVLSMPGNDSTDAVITARLRAEYFDTADQVLLEAKSQVVSLGAVGGFPVFIQRTAGRWLMSSEAGHVAAMATAEPAAYPMDRFGPQVEGAVAMAHWDWAGLAPMVAARLSPADGSVTNILVHVARTVSALLPSGSMTTTRSADGLLMQARNGLGAVALATVSATADVSVPALVRAYRDAIQAQAAARMRQIVARAIGFRKAQEGHWPRDRDDLRTWAKDLADDTFIAAGHPGIAHPFCYVPPLQEVANDQPILVQDPACNFGSGSLVGYGDGRVVMVPGKSMWLEALRLSALAKAEKRSIERAEWATLPKVF